MPILSKSNYHQLTYSLTDILWKFHKICAKTHTQSFNGLLSGTTRVGRYQKKHSPTHTHPDRRTSFINFLHLERSMASSLFSLRAWQSFRTTSIQKSKSSRTQNVKKRKKNTELTKITMQCKAYSKQLFMWYKTALRNCPKLGCTGLPKSHLETSRPTTY